MSKYQQHRCLELSRPSKNINLPNGGDATLVAVTGDIGVCDSTATGTEVLFNELRVSPLFTYVHTLGALQPRY